MKTKDQFQAVVINEKDEFVNSIDELLKPFPEICLTQCIVDLMELNEFISTTKPDLILLDFDKPLKNHLELLSKLELINKFQCKVIFFSILKVETLNLVSNENFDFVNKNSSSTEIKLALERFKSEKKSTSTNSHTLESDNKWISLQTNTGFRFTNKEDVVLFEYSKGCIHEKEKWVVHLNTSETFSLKMNTTSRDIFKHFDPNQFIQLCPKNIINIKYLKSIEFKTRKCFLHEPFQNLKLSISRSSFTEIKSRFEMR
jgi:DNA-binding LytR/AlgR family response regulator